MSKVICDICGTTYPDTAQQCPICGCAREVGAVMPDKEPKGRSEQSGVRSGKGGRFAAKNARRQNILDPFEEDEEEQETYRENQSAGAEYEDEEELENDFTGEDGEYEDEDPFDEDEYDDEDEEEEDGSSVLKGLLIVLLTLVIIGLLAVTGFLFFRYFLPNQETDQEQNAPTGQTDPLDTEESTVPTVPCTSLALTGGTPDLSFEGQNWLLNVVVVPENTTDVLTYTSADETVATVTTQGRVTAVGEGETVIYITCGGVTMECNVTVDYTEETEPSEEETIGEETIGEETIGEETIGEETTGEETTGETEGEETQPQETEPEETEALLDIELWCNYSDMTLFRRGETVTLRVNQELTLEDLVWTSENPDVATVENGVIKAVGHGNTKIIGTYGEQKVEIIVRCAFW